MVTIEDYCQILSKENRTGPASEKFMAWARAVGMPDHALLCFAACWIAQGIDGGIGSVGPMFDVTEIMRWTEGDPRYVSEGLLVIGFCPNGDFIALDARSKKGAVVYVSHDEYLGSDVSPRDCLIQIAKSLPEFVVSANQATLPMDYWEAIKREG
ncbi:MAG: SMI1/KNR4 family protein [Planctomycetota bacterium]